MSNAINLNLCILWEDEMRAAARLLHAAYELSECGASESEVTDAMNAAYEACMTALWGLRDDHAAVLMASGEIKQFGKAAVGKSASEGNG